MAGRTRCPQRSRDMRLPRTLGDGHHVPGFLSKTTHRSVLYHPRSLMGAEHDGEDLPAADGGAVLVLDHALRSLTADGRTMQELSVLEFRFIEVLHAAAPALVTTRSLGDGVWGVEKWDAYMVYNLARRVRDKLETAGISPSSVFISQRGSGYRLVLPTKVPAASVHHLPRELRRGMSHSGAVGLAAVAAVGVLLGLAMGLARPWASSDAETTSASRPGPSTAPTLATTAAATETISGVVVGRDGRPAQQVQVTACNERTPDPCPHVFTGADGRFSLSIEGGVYVVSFSEPGQSIPTRSISARTGGTLDVDFRH